MGFWFILYFSLQENLNDALEKLKVVNQLDKENQELLKENRNLKTKVCHS